MTQTECVKSEDISEVNELQRKADCLRDDNLFDVKIVSWSKVDENSVEVEFRVPSGRTKTSILNWPDKPNEDNKFIKLCMEAQNLDDPGDASMMAGNLKSPVEQDYTVCADVQDGEWVLLPDKKTIFSHLTSDDTEEDTANSLQPFGIILSALGGPISIFVLIVAGTLSEPGGWFKQSKSADQVYWFPQSLFYGLAGTIMWFIMLLFLSLM